MKENEVEDDSQVPDVNYWVGDDAFRGNKEEHLFRMVAQDFSFAHVKFEPLLRHPKGYVQIAGFMTLKLKKEV